MKLSRSMVVVLAGLLLGLTTLAYPWTAWDTASAAYLGRVVLEGGAPYRDAWNLKAPGVYFAYAVSILLFGKSALGIRIFDLLWQCATALLLARGGARMFRSEQLGVSVGITYLLLYYSQHPWNWGLADGLLTLPLAAGYLFLLRALESDRWLDWAGAAFSVGLAALFKITFGLVGIALLAVSLVQQGRLPKVVLRRLFPLAVGVSLPLLATAAYLWGRGALDEFLFTQFVLAPELTAHLRSTIGWSCIAKQLLRPGMLPLVILLLLAIRAWGWPLQKKAEWLLPALYCAAWFLAGAVTILLHGAFYAYHFQPLFGPLALLAAGGFEWFSAGLHPNGKPGRSVLALAVLGLFFLPPVHWMSQRLAFSWQVLSGHEPVNEWRELGTYLHDNTRPDERIFVWGNVPAVYLYAERESCSRFIFSYFLSVRWRTIDYRPVFLKELRSAMPRYFVIVKEGRPDPCSGHEIGALEAYEQFGELRQIVEREYVVDKQTADYVVYARRTERSDKARGDVSVPGT